MNVPDFLLVHCTTGDRPECASCGRDFLVPISAVAAFQRNSTGTVTVFLKKDAIGAHGCIGGCQREFHTAIAWSVLVAALNGTVEDVGNVTVDNQE